MREWKRAPVTLTCGRCAGRIAPGAPVLVLMPAMVRNRHYHCAACADEPVPADLPPARVAVTADPIPARLGRLVGSDLPLDWKTRRSGDE